MDKRNRNMTKRRPIKHTMTCILDDGTEKTLHAAGWSKLTGLASNTILSRYKREKDREAEGITMRPMREIVGLDDYQYCYIDRKKKVVRKVKPKIPTDTKTKLMNKFIFGGFK